MPGLTPFPSPSVPSTVYFVELFLSRLSRHPSDISLPFPSYIYPAQASHQDARVSCAPRILGNGLCRSGEDAHRMGLVRRNHAGDDC